jgi:hypothetical protein
MSLPAVARCFPEPWQAPAQQLMDYSWFDLECYPMQGMPDQEHFDSSYFVPKHRMKELEDENTE